MHGRCITIARKLKAILTVNHLLTHSKLLQNNHQSHENPTFAFLKSLGWRDFVVVSG